MHTTKHPKTEYGLTGVRTTADPVGQQRPLGKAYRLILSYDPQKEAADQGKVGEATPQTDDVQSVIG
jgi:hypothetical protein